MGDKEDSVRFGEKLRELRVSVNVSQDELAKAIDVDKSAISKWEDGLPARPQGVHRIRQIAEALDVSEFPLMVAAGYPVGIGSDDLAVDDLEVIADMSRMDPDDRERFRRLAREWGRG